MIVLGQIIFAVIVTLGLVCFAHDRWLALSGWAARRRRGRRAAWERRQRAARGGMYVDPAEFRRQFGVRLHELEQSDVARTFVAVAEYGRRASRGDA